MCSGLVWAGRLGSPNLVLNIHETYLPHCCLTDLPSGGSPASILGLLLPDLPSESPPDLIIRFPCMPSQFSGMCASHAVTPSLYPSTCACLGIPMLFYPHLPVCTCLGMHTFLPGPRPACACLTLVLMSVQLPLLYASPAPVLRGVHNYGS